ncbi:MAG: hypothetical protein DRP47_05155 [Candidatus Zixiibacteriota bacterium]|nr:MAG: hypothetical protein DRP47_05155 [candidate division Zixibacteria bacterium]
MSDLFGTKGASTVTSEKKLTFSACLPDKSYNNLSCYRVSANHLEVATVVEEKKKAPRLGLPRKTYWHLYSLQSLHSEKLVKIVDKVLKREFVLIK